MIVVTAPTGNIGGRVVSHLLDLNQVVRVVVRDPAKLALEVLNRVDVVQGSHGDATVVDRAFAGASALFWLAPADASKTPDAAYLDFTQPAADAVRRHGVKRIVSITALGRGTEWENKAGLATVSIRMDTLLMATGAAFRGLAMPSFMDNIRHQVASIRDQSLMLGASAPDRRAPKTAARDMGAAAARLLADQAWTGSHEVSLLGPEDLSMDDMAAIISDVLGREIRYKQISAEVFKTRMMSQGASEAFAQAYIDMFKAKDEGIDNVATRNGAERAPTTFREWCERELKPLIAG